MVKKKKLSQREIALGAGVHPNTVGNWKRGVSVAPETEEAIKAFLKTVKGQKKSA